MGYRIPVLKPGEVKGNLRALGFTHKRTNGSHETWERLSDKIMPQRMVVTVDNKVKEFDSFLMKSMIRQSGFEPEEFCAGTVSPARLRTAAALKPAPSTSENSN